MNARTSNPVMIVPEAMQALLALREATANKGIPLRTRELVHLRASQINGCSVRVDMHPRLAVKAGETEERLFAVGHGETLHISLQLSAPHLRSPRP